VYAVVIAEVVQCIVAAAVYAVVIAVVVHGIFAAAVYAGVNADVVHGMLPFPNMLKFCVVLCSLVAIYMHVFFVGCFCVVLLHLLSMLLLMQFLCFVAALESMRLLWRLYSIVLL